LSAINGKTVEIEPRFRLRAFDQITVGTEPAYLVKGLIPRVGLVVVWGPPKCGKSFWTFDLVMHVALGWPYRDRRVQRGGVVYVALEGASGFQARAEGFRQRFLPESPDPVPFYLVADGLNMAKDHAELIGCIRLQAKTAPAVVVIDTLNRSLGGSESDDKDMAAYIRAADAIRDAFGCAVIVVHHCGVDASRPRGHTSLTGAVDAQLAVKRDGSDNVQVTVEWMKDGPEGDVIASRLEPIEVGRDNDGDPITSCVVVPAEVTATPNTGRRKLSPKYELAFRSLTELAADIGTAPPATWRLPANIRIIGAESWKSKLISDGVLEAGDDARKRFWDIKGALKVKDLVGERDGSVWSAV
jgi:hypothetical protein